tara:strand:+ start:196 stop:387 length:192 start_codon:yes stop_codon:yes gene_type:complete
MSKEQKFHKEFKELLKKYNAEIMIDNNDIQDIKMVVEFHWDCQKEEKPTQKLNLGTFECADTY